MTNPGLILVIPCIQQQEGGKSDKSGKPCSLLLLELCWFLGKQEEVAGSCFPGFFILLIFGQDILLNFCTNIPLCIKFI